MSMRKMMAVIRAELDRIGAAANCDNIDGLQVDAPDLLPLGWVRVDDGGRIVCGPVDEILDALERCQGGGNNAAWKALAKFADEEPRKAADWPADLIRVEQLEPGTCGDNPNCLVTVRCNAGLRYTAGPHGADYCALWDAFSCGHDLYQSPEDAMADLDDWAGESAPVTRYRVYEAADGCGLVYCGEFDSLEEAEAVAEKEPGGVEESVWSTMIAARDDRAPDPAGIEEDEPLSWHGEQGWHCVVEVTYPAKDNN